MGENNLSQAAESSAQIDAALLAVVTTLGIGTGNRETARLVKQVRKNPGALIGHHYKQVMQTPGSIPRLSFDVIQYANAQDIDLTDGLFRSIGSLLDIGDDVAIDCPEFKKKGQSGQRTLSEYVALLAEEGALDGYYGECCTSIQSWVHAIAEKIVALLQGNFCTRYGVQPGKFVDYALQHTEALADRYIGAAVALTKMDNRFLQKYADMTGEGMMHFNLLSLGIRDIHRAITTRIRELMVVPFGSMDRFPTDRFRERVRSCVENWRQFKGEYIRSNDDIDAVLKTLSCAIPGMVASAFEDAERHAQCLMGIPCIAQGLEDVDFSQDTAACEPLRYPHGMVGLMELIHGRRWEQLIHYVADGTRRRSMIGFHVQEGGNRYLYPQMYPLGPSSLGFSDVVSCTVTDGHVHGAQSGQFTPSMCLDEMERYRHSILHGVRIMHGRLQGVLRQYPDYTDALSELGPGLFVLLPDQHFILCPIHNFTITDFAELFRSETVLTTESILDFARNYGFAPQAGQATAEWCAISLRNSDQSPNVDTELKLQPVGEQIGVDKEHRAGRTSKDPWPRQVRDTFTRPTLDDFIDCLRHIPVVVEVSHDRRSAGSGHRTLRVKLNDGSEHKKTTWDTIRGPHEPITWGVVSEFLKGFGLTYEQYYQAARLAGHRVRGKGHGAAHVEGT
jgi:hypothetical protein